MRYGGVQTAQSYGVTLDRRRAWFGKTEAACGGDTRRWSRRCRKAMSTSCGRCRFQ